MLRLKVQTQQNISLGVAYIHVKSEFIDSTQFQWNFEGTFFYIKDFKAGQ